MSEPLRDLLARTLVEEGRSSDNLVIALCSYFSDHMERPDPDPDTEHGWGEWVEAKANAALKLLAEAVSAPLQQEADKDGVYGASRVKHAHMWKTLRHNGHAINSSWIDEAGEGETGDFSELWERIRSEIAHSALLVLYVEPDDFPLKGALIECGMAMALGVPVVVCAPQVAVEGRTMRPLGSWILSGRVKRIDILEDAIAALPSDGKGKL